MEKKPERSLSKTADAITWALAAGGVELEMYRRPGFTGGLAVRRSEIGGNGSGEQIDQESDEGTIWDLTPTRR